MIGLSERSLQSEQSKVKHFWKDRHKWFHIEINNKKGMRHVHTFLLLNVL